MQKIHDGAIGGVTSMQVTYLTGSLWNHPRKPEWSEMENQVRNWLYYTWLSGDHITEQHIHSLDKAAWMMHDETPVAASASVGGKCAAMKSRQRLRSFLDRLRISQRHQSVFQLPADGQLPDDVSDHIIGTHGTAHMYWAQDMITGPNKWSTPARRPNMYQVEHNEMFAALRAGKRIDNTQYMSHSTMMAIMGRMAAYTGEQITWDQDGQQRRI